MKLGKVSDEVMVNGQPHWTLKSDERRKVLGALPDVQTARRLVKRSPATPDDAVGRALQAILVGKPVSLKAGPSADARYKALALAQSAPFAAARASADIKVLKRAIEAEYAQRP